MKKVLIVSWYFAPCSRMGAKRFGVMCKYFKENGYETYVIAAPSLITSEGMEAGLEIPIPPDHIFEVNMDTSNMYFTSAILVLLKKLKLCSRTIESLHFFFFFVKKEVDLVQLKNIGFDIVIGTYGPMANLYAAKYLSKKLKCKYIIDVRDFISDYKEKLPQGYRWASGLDYILEKISLHFSDGIVTVNPKMTKDMRKRYPRKKIITVYNGWDGWDVEQTECLDNDSEKYLYFAGVLYEFTLDGLVLLFNALRVVNEKEHIKMIIRCVGPQKVKVKRMVREMKMQEIVSCLPPVSEKVVEEERRKAYMNVIFTALDKDNCNMVSIPGKTYEYMHEKAPVLGVTLRNSKLAQILKYTGKGIGSAVESEIVDFILNADGKYEGNDNVLKFSRKYQASRLCRFMDYILDH